jgi:hypothetical protein
MKKDLKQLIKLYTQVDWRIEKTNGGRWRVAEPVRRTAGSQPTAPRSPGADGARARRFLAEPSYALLGTRRIEREI